MTWDYRVIEFLDPETEEPWREIHEVHYEDDGSPMAYSENGATVYSHDPAGVEADMGWVMDRMREALGRPVLTERDFPAPSVRGDSGDDEAVIYDDIGQPINEFEAMKESRNLVMNLCLEAQGRALEYAGALRTILEMPVEEPKYLLADRMRLVAMEALRGRP